MPETPGGPVPVLVPASRTLLRHSGWSWHVSLFPVSKKQNAGVMNETWLWLGLRLSAGTAARLHLTCCISIRHKVQLSSSGQTGWWNAIRQWQPLTLLTTYAYPHMRIFTVYD